MSERQPLLEARGIVKRFGHVVALNGADFELYPDEIVAVIGDNGAGKSTLIKSLSGALQPDRGEIRLDGKPVRFRSPGEARRAGIETVYQDLAVAPSLDIASNIFLGREARRRGPLGQALRMLEKRTMRREAALHLRALKIGVQSEYPLRYGRRPEPGNEFERPGRSLNDPRCQSIPGGATDQGWV